MKQNKEVFRRIQKTATEEENYVQKKKKTRKNSRTKGTTTGRRKRRRKLVKVRNTLTERTAKFFWKIR